MTLMKNRLQVSKWIFWRCNFGNVFFEGEILRKYFLKMHFLSEQFWKCISEGSILKMYFLRKRFLKVFWKSLFWRSKLENNFLEGPILREQFWRGIFWRNNFDKYLGWVLTRIAAYFKNFFFLWEQFCCWLGWLMVHQNLDFCFDSSKFTEFQLFFI